MAASGSHPYYRFGVERRYPYAWYNGQGGVYESRVAAASRGLGIFDLLESGDTNSIPYPPFRLTNLHGGHNHLDLEAPLGDYKLVRPAGPEPMDPHEGVGSFIDDLSDNEKKLAVVAVAVGLGWWFMRGRKRRRNPARRRLRYEVFAGSPRGRGMSYAMSFTSKGSADDYARSLRRDGRRASVRTR